jgi:hypothetical protein
MAVSRAWPGAKGGCRDLRWVGWHLLLVVSGFLVRISDT